MLAAIIQARMGSTRLPGKIMEVIGGKPMLGHVIDRCQEMNVDGVILATTTETSDVQVWRYAESRGIEYFRGMTDDVLRRYLHTAQEYHVEDIVRITADCPLLDVEIANKVIGKYMTRQWDYVSNIYPFRTCPKGWDIEVFSSHALQQADKNAESLYEREHVTPWMQKHLNYASVEANVSVDTEEDLIRVRKLWMRIVSLKTSKNVSPSIQEQSMS